MCNLWPVPESIDQLNRQNMKKIFIWAFVLLFSIAASGQNKQTRNVGDFTRVSFRVPGKLYLKQGGENKVELEGPSDLLKEIETEVKDGRLVIGKEGKWMNWNWDNDRITAYVTIKNLEGLSVSGSGDAIGESKFNTGDLKLNVSGSGSINLDATSSGNVEADVSGSGDLQWKGSCNNFDSDVSGSGKVIISVAIKGLADFGVSGSGKIQADGTAKDVKTRISGSGKVLASNMEAESCDISISGSGDVEVNVKNSLDATISGSGSVAYKGNPSHVNSHSSGSGHVRKM